MDISDLKLFNTCPLLVKQRGLYSETAPESSTISRILTETFGIYLFDKMRGRHRFYPHSRALDSWRKQAKQLPENTVVHAASYLAAFLARYEDFEEKIIGVMTPYKWEGIQGTFHLLSKTPVGTRITIFEDTIHGDRWAQDNAFLSIPVLAYRQEMGISESMLTLYDIRHGTWMDSPRSEERLLLHSNRIRATMRALEEGYSVPSYNQCPGCRVRTYCEAVR